MRRYTSRIHKLLGIDRTTAYRYIVGKDDSGKTINIIKEDNFCNKIGRALERMGITKATVLKFLSRNID